MATLEDDIDPFLEIDQNPQFHYGRRVSEKLDLNRDVQREILQILHSEECRKKDEILTCRFTKALEKGLYKRVWDRVGSEVVQLVILEGSIVPISCRKRRKSENTNNA